MRTLRDFGGLLKATNHYLGEPVPGSYARRRYCACINSSTGSVKHMLSACVSGRRSQYQRYCGIGLMPLSQSEAAWRV